MSPAGDFDYDSLGRGYTLHRRTDPRIAAMVHAALGDARAVLNVGAGAGSYEPADRRVLAVEPSAAMRAQRSPTAAPVVGAVAEALPFADRAFDAAMAMITIHQWPDLAAGLRQLRRVARGPVVLLTFAGDAMERFWLADYVPELIAAERRRHPRLDAITAPLGGCTAVQTVPIPIDCVDGFTEAFYARPERFLEDAVRRNQSSWGFVEDGVEARFVARLADDLASGKWDDRYADWRTKPFFEGSLRLLVNHR